MTMQQRQAPQVAPLDQPVYEASLPVAFSRFWAKAFTFTGRASRSEYWFVYLIGLIAGLVVGLFDFAARALGDPVIEYLLVVPSLILAVVAAVPGLALSVRRLHDANFSGWWLLLGLVPFGAIALLVMFVQDPNPLGTRFDAGRPLVPVPAGLLATPGDTGEPAVASPTPYADPPRVPRSDSGRFGARWALAGVGALVLVGVLAIAFSSLPRAADVTPAAPAQRTQETTAPQYGSFTLPPPSTDAKEAQLRAAVEADPNWSEYSTNLYFKWEAEKRACPATAAVRCATALIENISTTQCDTGTVQMSLLSNGTPVETGSARFSVLTQGVPAEVGVPFSPSSGGDHVRLDRIDCG